jgi:hypothetical protein
MSEHRIPSELTAALEQAHSTMRDELERVFEQRFADLEALVQASYRRSRNDIIASLNQTSRWLRAAGSREEWTRTLVEAAGPYCGKLVVVRVTQNSLVIGENPNVPLASAPAFANAVESKDTVVAVATPGELSQEISAFLGESSSKKIYLFPVVLRQNAVAILYAEPGERPVDVTALELLASIAAASLEGPEKEEAKAPAADLIHIAAAPAAPRPAWTDLPRPEQEQHLRAQRFARTRVAQILLHKERQVRDGRRIGNLYGALREEIEAAREAFRKEFIETCPSMVDYLHLELQRTLAKDSPDALGFEYPGPLPVGAGAAR